MLVNKLLEIIKKFDTITIFTHQTPDGDALGSQWALQAWLKKHFPNKDIFVINEGNRLLENLFPRADIVSDDVIKSSLAIVVDTANQARINDKRAWQAQSIIKIDHHDTKDDYGELQIVNSKSASNTELLTNLFNDSNLALDKEIATYLMIGLITDTVNFSTKSTSENTFLVASKLMQHEVDLVSITKEINSFLPDIFNFETKLRSKIVVSNKLAYCIVKKDEYQAYNLTANIVKESVNVLKTIKGIEIWALFTEDENKEDIFNGSLRSSHLTINKTAELFGGGGHKQAAGVKDLSMKDINVLLKKLNELIG